MCRTTSDISDSNNVIIRTILCWVAPGGVGVKAAHNHAHGREGVGAVGVALADAMTSNEYSHYEDLITTRIMPQMPLKRVYARPVGTARH